MASWLRPPPCPDGAKAQLVRCLLGNVSLAPGCESKVTGEGDKDALLHLGATPKPISTKAGWSTRHQAHTELGKLHPQARLWAPPTGTGSWSLAPRLQKSRPDVRWVFTCYKFLHIKKKKKIVHVKRENSAFPPVSPAPELTAWVLKGPAHPSISWGSRPSPPPAPQSPNQDAGPVFGVGGRRGCAQEKEKTLLLLAQARVFTRGNINYSVPKLALLF